MYGELRRRLTSVHVNFAIDFSYFVFLFGKQQRKTEIHFGEIRISGETNKVIDLKGN